MITVHHVILHGNILNNTNGISHYLSQFAHVFVYCGTNCFGLITGYVLYQNRTKLKRIFNLYAQVLFYSFGIFLVSALINPQIFTLKNVLISIFPFIKGNYWYFTAYLGIFFFIPFFNKLLDSIDIQATKNLLIKLVIIFSVLPTIFFCDMFQTKTGYSALWLAILYIIGASVKKLDLNINKKTLLTGYLVLTLINFLTITGFEHFVKISYILNYKNIFMPYISPVMLFSAIILLILFSKTNIKKIQIQKIISFITPTVFGIYLFQETPLINNIIKAFTENISFVKPLFIIPSIIKYALIIFIFGIIIEKSRNYLFKIISCLFNQFKQLFIKSSS